jgi:hypothetical protein
MRQNEFIGANHPITNLLKTTQQHTASLKLTAFRDAEIRSPIENLEASLF